MAERKRPALSVTRVRSALTNGTSLFLGDIDQRGSWVRRLRDLQRQHEEDLGGRDGLSEGQMTILQRIAMLELQLELMESRFAANDGEASNKALETYQRVTNTLRRSLESLGLHKGRVARNVTPPTVEAYVQHRYGRNGTASRQ
jgi:hypothetical protein